MRNLLGLCFGLALFISVGCGGVVDQSLQERIRQTTTATEDLFENYEDLNDELFEITEKYEKAYKKLIKAKDAHRELNTQINNRNKRIQGIQTPTVKEGEPVAVVDNKALEGHQEKLAEYQKELQENIQEIEKWTTLSKELNEKALALRPARNAAYNAYIKSREDLKDLQKQLDSNSGK